MQKFNKYSRFEIESFLSDYGVDYKSSGKNIGRNWWGVKDCPFCGDSGYHLGINLTTKKVSCFVCGESSMIPRFIKETLKLDNWGEVLQIVGKYIDGDIYIDPRSNGTEVIWPTEVSQASEACEGYLKNRNFSKEIIEKYRLKQTSFRSYLYLDDEEHDFRWRVIIPIIMNKQVVSYTGRSYNGRDPKYQHASLEASIVSSASCIYNYDTLTEGGTGIFVEGPTDVWRFGDQAVAMMGVKYTKKQLKFIADKKLKRAVIVFDENAYTMGRKLAEALIGIVDIIRMVDIGGGDPGELDPIESIRIKSQLLRC